VNLGPELGRGGEAAVYGVDGDRSVVAKIYHQQLDAEKLQKLRRMVLLQNERILKLAAWPVGILRSRNGNSLSGVLMRNVTGFKDIHLLYNPKSRVREFPSKANWNFLIHAGGNVARAFAVIHEYGHVIGDVNQSNVRVSPESAVVSLIDCDSFQISSQGRYFLCGVGVPLYTPPELQGLEFKNVIRTPNHDNFGLAVLLFHLLFMGRHPFAGRFLGRGDMPIEKAIGEFRFAFTPDSARTQMQPPPNCITLAHLSPAIAELFVKAFAPSGVQNGRPSATEWVTALDSFSRQLKKCPNNGTHTFFQALAACPWCAIEVRAGILLFVGYVSPDGTSHFKAEIIWAQIASVQSPGAVPLPDFGHLAADITATPEARSSGWKRRGAVGIVVFVVVLVVGACLAASAFAVAFWTAIAAFAIGKSLIRKTSTVKSRFENEARATEARYTAAKERWQREASDQPFKAKLAELRKLAEEHQQLPNLRQQRLRDLERDLYNVQLRHYLEKFNIASATIPHVKDSRKAMLSSFGIDDAADVTPAAVEAVPGFGQFLTGKMMDWRRSLETKFIFDPKRGLDPVDVKQIDQAVEKLRSELELRLSRGQPELNEVRRRVLLARAQLQDQMQKAWMEMAQAQANARAA